MKAYSLLIALALAACTHAPAPRPAPPAVIGRELLVHVAVLGELPENALTGVKVTALTDDGKEVNLGATFVGVIHLDKEMLRRNHANVLLFCLPPYFRCVALRVADDDLYRFNEYWVDLPKIVYR